MKRLLYLITICASFVGCTAERTKYVPQPSDTLYTKEAAQTIYARQPERALLIVDSAEIVGNMPDFDASLLRAQIYSRAYEMQRYDTARAICEDLLRHDSVKANPLRQTDVLDLLAYVARMQGGKEGRLRYTTQLVELYRSVGDETEALRTEAEIGNVLTQLGFHREGMAKLDHVIHRLDRVHRFNELDASIIAMKRKINVLEEQHRYAEMQPLAQRIIDRLTDYELHPETYSDGTYREPKDDEDRTCYIDFYRSQAYAFLAEAYAHIPTSDVPDARQQARHYSTLFEQSEYGQTYNGRVLIAPVWRALGEYDKMLTTYAEVEQRMEGDTLNEDYTEILKGRAMAAAARGRHAESENLWHRYARLNNIVNDSLQATEARAYAARYHSQEQQMALERKEADLSRSRLYTTGAIIVATMALGFMVYYYRQRRLVNEKNRVLVQQINEAMAYRAKYFGEQVSQEESKPSPPRGERGEGLESLFLRLRDTILHERLFLDPNFDRQAVCQRFSLTKESVGAAFSQGSNYKSVADFIRECRLTYACHLLATRPDLSVSDVATASGYSNLSVFSRQFKERYTLSPTAYRSKMRIEN